MVCAVEAEGARNHGGRTGRRRKNREIAQLEKQKTAAADLAKATEEVKAATSDKDKEAAAQHLADAQKNLAQTVKTASKETAKEDKKAEATTAAMAKQAAAAPPPAATVDSGTAAAGTKVVPGAASDKECDRSGRIAAEKSGAGAGPPHRLRSGRSDRERSRGHGPNQALAERRRPRPDRWQRQPQPRPERPPARSPIRRKRPKSSPKRRTKPPPPRPTSRCNSSITAPSDGQRTALTDRLEPFSTDRSQGRRREAVSAVHRLDRRHQDRRHRPNRDYRENPGWLSSEEGGLGWRVMSGHFSLTSSGRSSSPGSSA